MKTIKGAVNVQLTNAKGEHYVKTCRYFYRNGRLIVLGEYAIGPDMLVHDRMSTNLTGEVLPEHLPDLVTRWVSGVNEHRQDLIRTCSEFGHKWDGWKSVTIRRPSGDVVHNMERVCNRCRYTEILPQIEDSKV